jgi:hypothetical protein
MALHYLPLLKAQLDLYALPRGMERFRAYIKAMTDEGTGDLALPLVAMNPMGKDHIPALIEQYMALDAEAVAANTVEEAWAKLRNPGTPERGALPTDFKVSLVVSDDLKGGWTNRWASEFSHRIEGAAITKRGFLVGILWTSEPATENAVREAVLTSIYRAEYLQTHTAPKTLAEILAQEGYATARAGCTTPSLDGDDLSYTRDVIEPHLSATARATVIPCLFGDAAANALGYPPQGLSDRAGFALALHDAKMRMKRMK